MQFIEPPDRPVAISALPKDQQAQAMSLLYANAAAVAGKCLKTRDVLIQWINGE